MTLALRKIGLTGRSRLALTAVFLAVGISGCASFKEVKTFASLSSNAAGYDAITRDYIGAIDRRKQYQPAKFHGELEALKMRRKAQCDSLDVLQQTVTDYMRALGSLASGETRTFDRSLVDFSDSLNEAALLDSNEKQAVGVLSTLLARSVTAVYRQHEMKKLIREGNQPLQDVIETTRKIVRNGIVADLQVESAIAGRYYDNFMFAPDNPVEPVAMALGKEAKAEALARVDNRIRSAQRYDAVMDKIAIGHQYLYDHRAMIGNDELDRQFKPYIDELRAAYRNLLDATR
ncbi:MAG: hypothetical protein M3Q16_12200 [Pseudomonadota bacterium]|nr:hypothetical protein [Pseudomonadota bacterium]